jgi:N6-adenosine-specific RNA methylase IME4
LKKEKIKIQEHVKLPNGLYNVILADPPYQYEFSESRRCDIEVQYPTMNLDEIKSIKVPAADNCVLFLWSPAPKLLEALEVMQTCSFDYKTCAVWDKLRPGTGFWLRAHHELLLVGTKGNPRVPEPENRYASVIHDRRIIHSKKPACVYDIIEKNVSCR